MPQVLEAASQRQGFVTETGPILFLQFVVLACTMHTKLSSMLEAFSMLKLGSPKCWKTSTTSDVDSRHILCSFHLFFVIVANLPPLSEPIKA